MLAVSDSLILGGEAVGEGRRGGRLRRRGRVEIRANIPDPVPDPSQILGKIPLPLLKSIILRF